MFSLCFGIAGFVLYLLYDINSFTLQRRIPRCFFMLGTLLIAIATIADLRTATAIHAFSGIADIIFLGGAVICFAALIYTLFFALPFKETYADQTNGRPVYDGGVYGLCRHPGILCFWGLYLLLGIAALPGKLLVHGIIFSALNTAYALFQDRITFPKTFTNYDEYQKKVPFLIPRSADILRAFQIIKQSGSEEDDK